MLTSLNDARDPDPLRCLPRLSFSTASAILRGVVPLRAPRARGSMAEPAITQDEHGLKQRAMRRLAIALTVIAAAIVALAVLDRYNSVPKKTAVPAGPPEPALPPAAEAPPRALPPGTSDPSREAERLPPPPVSENQPARSTLPPAASSPEPTPKKSPAASSHLGEPEKSPPIVMEQPAAPAASLAASAAARGASARGKGFIVQVGVFMSAANAHALQNRLAETGIPTHTETRLVVGPLKDRAEADAVMRQLKTLGVEAVVLPPPAAQ